MAKRIKAIIALRARFKHQRPLAGDELAEEIARKSNLSHGDVYHALLELSTPSTFIFNWGAACG